MGGGETSRGYKDTYYKHAGAAVEVTFSNVKSSVKAGVMGLIFDLESKEGKRSFNVVGVRTTNANGGLDFFVSRFTNVEDIQDKNFGAWEENGKKGPASEVSYAGTGTSFPSAKGTYDSSADTTKVYVYAIEKKAEKAGTDSANQSYAKDEYIYEVYLLNNKIAKLDSSGNLVDENGNSVDLSSDDVLATIATGYTSLTQKKLAVYANVYAGKTLSGTWTYRGDYKEVGVDED